MNLRLPSRVILLVVLAGICAAAQFAIGPRPAAIGPGEISVAAARALPGPILWVDARTREKFAAAHIPGAVLLNGHEWETLAPLLLDAWEPGTTIIVYCDGGACTASHDVAARIRTQFELPDKVLVLKGGWEAWQSAS